MKPRYQGRRAIVLGLGMTGLSLVRHLLRHGADVRVADTRDDPPNLEALAVEFPQVRVDAGRFSDATFDGVDLIAASPGVDLRDPAIRVAAGAGVEIAGDIELFARSLPPGQRLLAVTGTNGKTTVASLTGPCTPWQPTRKIRSGARPVVFVKSSETGYMPQ